MPYPNCFNSGGNSTGDFQTTAFGELMVAEPSPVVQISAQYGLTDETMEIVSNGGQTSNGDSLFKVNTNTHPLSIASLNTSKQLAYKPGQGLLCRLSALFSSPAPNSLLAAGLINSEDALAFGYLGETFGILYSRNGKTEHQELTVIVAGTGVATITIDGVDYSVTLTAGDTFHNAQEIAASLTSQVPNFLFTANNNIVSSMNLLPQVDGIYDFTGSTATATWEQQQVGREPDITLIPQSRWNRKTLQYDAGDEWVLNPQTGNVYSISLEYLGFGGIAFQVKHPETRKDVLVHIIEYSNANILPSVGNPTFRVGWLARNLGNTTDVFVHGASAAGFIEGEKVIDTIPRAVESVTGDIGTTQTNVITIRNRFHFGDKINRADIVPLMLSMGTESIKGAFFRLTANATFSGDLNFTYVDEDNSIAETATDQVTVSGGRFIASFIVTQQGRVIGSNEFNIRIFPDDYLTLSAAVTANPATPMSGAAVWQEDL